MPDRAERLRHENRLHHLLWEMYARMEVVADEVFAGSGLSNAMVGTLDLIGTWPGATVAELSRHTPKSQQGISQLVAKLEKLGYVERRLGSGRGVRLHLTDSGHAARAAGERHEQTMEDRLLESLGPALYAELADRLSAAVARMRD